MTDLRYSPVAVGDNIEFELDQSGLALIERVLPRKHFLVRPDVYLKERWQVIAANLDQLVIITSTAEPAFKPGLVDRFLVSAEHDNLEALIVLNKIDLEETPHSRAVAEIWQSLGYEVICTSAKSGEGIDRLEAALKDKTSALTGHSGVGKSALINAIDPTLLIKTAEISAATGKGIHTTSLVRMFPLEIGGWVVDTPGLKVFAFSNIEPHQLMRYFPEFARYESQCRFANCEHLNEPSCAVKEAVSKGEIAQFRYQDYEKFWGEVSGNK